MTSTQQYSRRRPRVRAGRLALALTALAMAVIGTISVVQQLVPRPNAEVASASGVPDGAEGADANGTWGLWDDAPVVTNLDPALLAALQEAAVAAESDGITLRLTSGWRSAEYQQSLFDRAVQDYGSVDEAERWVASPHRSAHVQGLAVDIATTDAYSWLDQHGAAFGLCRTFANEGWHFELREISGDGWCPDMLPDASADPRRW